MKMVEDALFVSAYPLPPNRCSGTFTDYTWNEDEDNGDNDYVQSLCLVKCPDNDLNETNRSDDMSFSEHPFVGNQRLCEGDIEDNIESEYDVLNCNTFDS
jgi:hypothetical protein